MERYSDRLLGDERRWARTLECIKCIFFYFIISLVLRLNTFFEE